MMEEEDVDAVVVDNVGMEEEENQLRSRPGTGISKKGEDSELRSRPGTGLSQKDRPLSGVSTASSNAWNIEENNCDDDEVTTPDGVSLSSTTDNSQAHLIRDEKQQVKGCWYHFTRFVGGLWSTREMSHAKDREVYVRTTIRELVIYCIFLTTLCITTFGMTSPTQYFYSDILQRLFEDNQKVTTVEEFWEFMEGQFLDSLYFEYEYNSGESTNFICPGGDDSVGPCPVAPSDRNILYENRLIGVPRLRQLRVRNGTCDLHEEVQRMTRSCFAEYSREFEDIMPFNDSIKEPVHTSPSAWMYQSEESIDGVSSSGILASYSGAGAVQDLASTRNETAAILKELKEGLWVSRPTRFVKIAFTVYNANINLFCVVTIFFEFPATGGVIPYKDFHTINLLRYVNPFDYFILACELLYCCFVAYYIVEESIEIRQNGFPYFRRFWNLLDLGVIAVSLLNLTLTVFSIARIERDLGDLLAQPDKYADFSTLGFWSSVGEIALALCIFMSWIKLLKYITFNRTMVQLTKTLSRAANDLLAFLFLFMLAFMAFAQLGYFLFHSRIQDYSTITDSIFTLLRTILGDFRFRAIQTAEPFWGPLYFTMYVLYVYFILLNMFLAIINDTFTEVKAEIEARRLAYDVGDYLKRGYNNLLGQVGGSRDKAIDIENALKIAAEDGRITYDEIRAHLKRAGFADMEIEVFFSKYDKNGDGTSLDNTDEMFDDLVNDDIDNLDDSDADEDNDDKNNKNKNNGKEGCDGGDENGDGAMKEVTLKDLFDLCLRVDKLDHAIGGVVAKLETAIKRMAAAEKSKEDKRDIMSVFMNPRRRDSELVQMVEEASSRDEEEEEDEEEEGEEEAEE